MKKNIIFIKLISFILPLTLFSCQTESEKCKIWLEASIKNCFKNDNGKMNKICTKKYEKYKMDAIGTEYDYGLSKEEFVNKWSKFYDTNKAGFHNGFLLCAQDWVDIKANCRLIESNENYFVFETEIIDSGFKDIKNCTRLIKVIRIEDNYLIDDVVELE